MSFAAPESKSNTARLTASTLSLSGRSPRRRTGASASSIGTQSIKSYASSAASSDAGSEVSAPPTPPPLSEGDKLRLLFTAYAKPVTDPASAPSRGPGLAPPAFHLTSGGWGKFVRDCPALMDATCNKTELQLLFAKARPKRADGTKCRSLLFPHFLAALTAASALKYPQEAARMELLLSRHVMCSPVLLTAVAQQQAEKQAQLTQQHEQKRRERAQQRQQRRQQQQQQQARHRSDHSPTGSATSYSTYRSTRRTGGSGGGGAYAEASARGGGDFASDFGGGSNSGSMASPSAASTPGGGGARALIRRASLGGRSLPSPALSVSSGRTPARSRRRRRQSDLSSLRTRSVSPGALQRRRAAANGYAPPPSSVAGGGGGGNSIFDRLSRTENFTGMYRRRSMAAEDDNAERAAAPPSFSSSSQRRGRRGRRSTTALVRHRSASARRSSMAAEDEPNIHTISSILRPKHKTGTRMRF